MRLSKAGFMGILALPVLILSSLQASSQTRQLEEVIVTAQKRAQSVLDVPIAVSAYTGNKLEELNIEQITDLSRIAPSLTYNAGNQRQNTGLRIRGIGTNVFSIGVEPSVAVMIDEVAQVQSGQAWGNLVDIERVEVLRGPQSTLFGKNASAGVLSVTTKAPSDELSGFVEVTVTDDEQEKITGSISGPLSDTTGFRLSAFYSDHDGYADNLFNGQNTNNQETSGVRGKFHWDINDNADFTLTAFVSKEESNCCALSFRQIEPTAAFLGALPVTLTNPQTFDIASESNSTVERDNDQPAEVDDKGFNMRLNWGIGEHTLTAITGFNEWNYENSEDIDFSGFDVAGVFTGGALSGGIHTVSTTDTTFFSQEFRLSSPSSDTFEYLVGLYYADAETDRTFQRPIITSDWAGSASTASYALFGQLTWKINDKAHLTIGARYNNEEIDVQYTDNASGNSFAGDDDEDATPGKIALQYFANDETMLFASITTGHKGQAYDISSGFNQARIDSPVGNESSISYEAGIKTTLLDRTLQLSAVAFMTEYDDYQAQNTELRGTELIIGVLNVGTLETTGLEFEATALIGENLTLSANAAWVDATVDEFPDANCYPGQTMELGCVELVAGSGVNGQNLAGKDLNNSPDLKFTLNADYRMPLSSLPFDGFINANYNWQDDIVFDLLQNPLTRQDSYGTFNLNVGIVEAEDARYKVTIFVQNLFDEDYAASIADISGLYGGSPTVFQFLPRNAQRYAGVRLRYGF